MQTRSSIFVSKPLSFAAKFELAYKIAESALFLLGTPWFAKIRKQTVRRLDSPDLPQDYFSFNVSTLDCSDLLCDDWNALAEPSQIFQIGKMLVEIALDDADLPRLSEERCHEGNIIDVLPRVERVMGPQYCRAVAYCLLQRSDRGGWYVRPEKYEAQQGEKWRGYLEEILHKFFACVFVR